MEEIAELKRKLAATQVAAQMGALVSQGLVNRLVQAGLLPPVEAAQVYAEVADFAEKFGLPGSEVLAAQAREQETRFRQMARGN